MGVHVRDENGRILCGEAGESISLAEALDPNDGRSFTCGRCLVALAGGREPSMGGSQP